MVQICEIHTNPSFFVCLLLHDDVSQPLRVVHLVDEHSRQELVDFIHDGFVPFRCKTLLLWWTSFFPRSTSSQCWMTFSEMLGMSLWLHANTSRFLFRNSTIPLFISGPRFDPMFVTFVGSPSTSYIVSSVSIVSGIFYSIIHVWFSFDANTAW